VCLICRLAVGTITGKSLNVTSECGESVTIRSSFFFLELNLKFVDRDESTRFIVLHTHDQSLCLGHKT
jgi:hypothetical protein